MSGSLPILAFECGVVLRDWLEQNHASSHGVWVRVYKRDACVSSVTF